MWIIRKKHAYENQKSVKNHIKRATEVAPFMIQNNVLLSSNQTECDPIVEN